MTAVAEATACGPSAGVGGQARRGRPRDQRLDEEVTSAALEVLADLGFERFSVEEVAARSGVAKTTVYRRYPTRDALIEGALARLVIDLPEPRESGDLREELTALLEVIRRRTPVTVGGRIVMRAVSEADASPTVTSLVHERVIAPRQRHIAAAIERAIARGELRSDLDVKVVLPMLVGPMLYLGIWHMCDQLATVSVEDVVDTVIRGLAPASG